jgi:hypothetical protein
MAWRHKKKKAYRVSYGAGKGAIQTQLVLGSTLDIMDSYHLSMKPTFEACKYMKMKAHRNHYRALGENHANAMVTYDGVEWP